MSSQNNRESDTIRRVKASMALRGANMRRLADLSGIPYRTLQNNLLGKHAFSAEAAARVAQALDVSLDWLLTGQPCRFDEAVLAQCLSLIEDVRVLSNHKTDFDECAKLFNRFYDKFYRERLRDPSIFGDPVEPSDDGDAAPTATPRKAQ